MNTRKTTVAVIVAMLVTGAVSLVLRAGAMQGDAAEPVRYLRPETVDVSRPDGGLRIAVGAQNYQIVRSFRNDAPNSDGFGWTYHHEPMIHYWNSTIYVSYKSTPKDEDAEKGHILLSTSSDVGRTWSFPVVVRRAAHGLLDFPGRAALRGRRLHSSFGIQYR
jgi:hypothetical protein